MHLKTDKNFKWIVSTLSIFINGDFMNYIDTPYLPKEKVSLFIADIDIPDKAVITPYYIDVLPPSMRRHADLGIVIVSSNKAVCPPESCAYYKNALCPYGFEIIEGKTHIGSHYPKDSAYNVGIVGKKSFLNKNVCDELLYEILISEGYEITHIKQGYAKCSICPIDENTFITADISIAREGEKRGCNVLLISNEGISLPGFSNGFWGGCCGMGGINELLISGDITNMPSGEKIIDFLEERKIKIKNLRKGDVLDIGSIIPLMTT